MQSIVEVWKAGRILRESFVEQQACIEAVYANLERYLSSPSTTPADYAVRPAAVPEEFLALRRNLFSTLFHSMYHLLEIPAERRLMYGKLIHLFRIWVTSADNLLDDEDKVVVPIEMPGSARIMRQVVSIMAADRVLADLLEDGLVSGTLSRSAARRLRERSICELLPSAAQEATEEDGIRNRPDPGYVLETIHRLKTGLLFNITFTGPEVVEDSLDHSRATVLKDALMDFGLGCQMIDDIRDLARDLVEKRHNYVLSTIAARDPDLLAELEAGDHDAADRLYLRVPEYTVPISQAALQRMSRGLQTLGAYGLGIERQTARDLSRTMLTVLDVEDLSYA
jgi:hypothetical protein